jgi:hypothetical protein
LTIAPSVDPGLVSPVAKQDDNNDITTIGSTIVQPVPKRAKMNNNQSLSHTSPHASGFENDAPATLTEPPTPSNLTWQDDLVAVDGLVAVDELVAVDDLALPMPIELHECKAK